MLVPSLSKMFNVTEETIRRDLEKLESQSMLVRTYGGATLPENTNSEMPVEIRQIINIDGKNLIGKEAACMVSDGETIILDASTSCLHLARNLKDKKGLTVITNSEKIIQELAAIGGITLISTGGIFERESFSYIGRAAENMVLNYNAGKCFISSSGFTISRGLTVSSEYHAEIKKAMIKASDRAIYLIDHTKFGRLGFASIAGIDSVKCLITDRELSGNWPEDMHNYSIEFIIAK